MNTRKIDFGDVSKIEVIECNSFQEGDWIVFKSPLFEDYERRLNWKTGEMTIKNDKPDVNHTGTYIPEAFKNLN